MQDQEETRLNRSIALKTSQEKDDLLLLNCEDIELDENYVTLMTKTSRNSLTTKEDSKEMGQTTTNF